MEKRRIKLIVSRQSWTMPYAIFAAIFVVLPLLLIVAFAFTDEEGCFSFCIYSPLNYHE